MSASKDSGCCLAEEMSTTERGYRLERLEARLPSADLRRLVVAASHCPAPAPAPSPAPAKPFEDAWLALVASVAVSCRLAVVHCHLATRPAALSTHYRTRTVQHTIIYIFTWIWCGNKYFSFCANLCKNIT